MREISVIELEYMASRELCELARNIDRELPSWPESSLERRNRAVTLRNIRWVLKRRWDFVGTSCRDAGADACGRHVSCPCVEMARARRACGIRNLAICSMTLASGPGFMATSLMKADHCVCFVGSPANAGVRASGR